MTVKSEYGHALYLLAKEIGAVEEIKIDLTAAYEIFKKNPEYSTILDTPAISKGEKLTLVDEAFKPLNENLVSLIKILSEKHSVATFKDVYTTFMSLYNEDMGIIEVEAVTAIPMSENQIAALREKIKLLSGKCAQIKNTVDPTILGGVKLRYEGVQIDASIKTRLDGFAASLRNISI